MYLGRGLLSVQNNPRAIDTRIFTDKFYLGRVLSRELDLISFTTSFIIFFISSMSSSGSKPSLMCSSGSICWRRELSLALASLCISAIPIFFNNSDSISKPLYSDRRNSVSLDIYLADPVIPIKSKYEEIPKNIKVTIPNGG